MSLATLLSDPKWDEPFFKVLSNNDTGAAPGNQGGIVIPIPLRTFFPALNPAAITEETPTTDHRIQAELWDGDLYLEVVDTRYQIQTWGGRRRPETRLTDRLGPLRNRAVGEDVLLFQRHANELEHYRLILVRRSNASMYEAIREAIGEDRWGILQSRPVDDEEITFVANELTETHHRPFSIFEDDALAVESRRRHLARSTIFRGAVLSAYAGTCAACGTGLRTPRGWWELEAAHIVPRQKKGVNDVRNGLGLCRRHHWAFDRGLFSVDENRLVVVPERSLQIPQNEPLLSIRGRRIIEASNPTLLAHPDALAWHREFILIR